MKSPNTGKEMKLTKVRKSLSFRKEEFEIVFHSFLCEDSNEHFTTTALDEVNMNQVYNQYRDRFNIPFPVEIIRIRKKYDLPVTKMSNILGFGINSYRQYETGEMPSIANARLIQLIDDPNNFINSIELCDLIDDKAKEKYKHTCYVLIEKANKSNSEDIIKNYLMGNHLADIHSGYRNPSLEKFTEMVVYFSEQLQPFKTKMNKLLFYADFLMFKKTCFSISGVRYAAIDRGPVPNNFQSIFEYIANKDEIDICSVVFPEGFIGEQFKARKDRPFNSNLFTSAELEILNEVSSTFKKVNAIEISELSHLEKAWKENEGGKRLISYEYAFELNGAY